MNRIWFLFILFSLFAAGRVIYQRALKGEEHILKNVQLQLLYSETFINCLARLQEWIVSPMLFRNVQFFKSISTSGFHQAIAESTLTQILTYTSFSFQEWTSVTKFWPMVHNDQPHFQWAQLLEAGTLTLHPGRNPVNVLQVEAIFPLWERQSCAMSSNIHRY